jgi:hypothetical protein
VLMTQGNSQTHQELSPVIKESVVLLLLLLSVLALHAGTLRKPFFADDYFFLEQVRGQSLPSALASPDPLGNFLRPVSRQAYFWVLSRMGNESPVVFHGANLLLFLGSLAFIYLVARRLGGVTAAFIATAFLGFHYAADVPLRWASGSQDLLALFFASAAVWLHLGGRRVLAAIALLLALLSKESVALAAALAIVADHKSGEPWRASLRRGSLLVLISFVWAASWALTLRNRPATGDTLSLAPGDVLSAVAHLVQVASGLEFRLGGSAVGHWSIVGFLVAAVAAALVWLSSRAAPDARAQDATVGLDLRSPLVKTGIVWAIAGTMPLVLVMPIWSAYYYLFALVGVAFVAAGIASTLDWKSRMAVLGALALFSANARALDEFATSRGAWVWQSHVDRHYIDRATSTNDRFLKHLRTSRPVLPPHSTVFFANVPVSLGWQAGNGPLLRWAYRDSSLRSYFLTQFSRERAERGPVFFFAVEEDSLVDKTESPMMLPSFAYSMLLAERPQAAVEALDLAMRTRPADSELLYWRAWAHWGAGDTLLALSDLEQAGMRLVRALPPGTEQVSTSAQDTTARIAQLLTLRDRAVLNAWAHARLAAIFLALPDRKKAGVIEAYAFKVLAPDEADAWRKWSSAQLSEQHYEPALKSLERYLELAEASGKADREANQVVHTLRRIVRGDMAQQALQAR